MCIYIYIYLTGKKVSLEIRIAEKDSARKCACRWTYEATVG